MFPHIDLHLASVEIKLQQLDAVKKAQVQPVPGHNLVTAIIDMDVKKPMTLSVIAEILEVLNETFGGQQTPMVEIGCHCICISDLKFHQSTGVEYVQHTYT